MMRHWMVGAAALAAVTITAESGIAQPGPRANTREYVFVGSGGGRGTPGQVTTYTLDRNTGALTQVSRVDAGDLVSYIAINPVHPVVYATNERGGNMHWLRVDPATGQLTHQGSQTSNGNPVYANVDATGRTLMAVIYGGGTVDAFPLDPNTGAIAGPPINYATGQNSHSIQFHPSNQYAYVAAVNANHIAQYSFRDGVLTPLSPPTLTVEGGPRHLFMHPSGNYLYAVFGNSDNVAAFRIAENGTLTEIGRYRRLQPEFADAPQTHMGSDIEVTPDGRFVYAANRGESNTLAIYSVGQDGGLTLVGHESTRGRTPRNFAIDPDGELIIVGNQDSQTVAVFRINQSNGTLTHLATTEVGVNPWFVGIWRLPVN